MANGCALSTGYLPRGGLPRNSVDRITDRLDMTSAVDRERKASTQTNKQTNKQTCASVEDLSSGFQTTLDSNPTARPQADTS